MSMVLAAACTAGPLTTAATGAHSGPVEGCTGWSATTLGAIGPSGAAGTVLSTADSSVRASSVSKWHDW